MRFRSITAAAIAVCLLTAQSASPNVIVDGELGDWGISLTDDHANYGGMSGRGTANLGGRSFQYHEEDQSDTADVGKFLGPNHGGQDYDAEFLGAGFEGGKFVIAILTGQRPDNIARHFLPGDIRIETAAQEWFGIEVGGGPGGGGESGQITEGDAGTTYDVDSGGFATSVTEHLPGESDQLAGAVFEPPTAWQPDPIPGADEPIDPQLTTGTYAGLSDYIYLWNADSQHAVIEIAVDTSLFGDEILTGVEWAPSCGNDVLRVDFEPDDQIPRAPEPASLALMALGTLGLLTRRATKKRAKSEG